MKENDHSKFERPPRSESLERVIDLSGQALKASLGEDAEVLPRENIHWVSQEEFEYVHDNQEDGRRFVKAAFAALGIEWNGFRNPENIIAFITVNRPVNVYISEPWFTPALQDSIIEDKIGAEIDLASIIIKGSIAAAAQAHRTEDARITELVQKKLMAEQKALPKMYTDSDPAELAKIVDTLSFLIENDETTYTICQGAEVRCMFQYEGRDQELARTGVDTQNIIERYLTLRALKDFAGLYVSEYPLLAQPHIKRIVDGEISPSTKDKFNLARFEGFRRAIGLSGHRDTFEVFRNSQIAQRFVEAGKKTKNLMYS